MNIFTVNVVTKQGGRTSNVKRILVVDDDRDLVETTRTFLEARGYAVSTAHSGLEARDELAKVVPTSSCSTS